MKAQDIRIGNLFTQKGFPMYVEAIFKDTVYLNFEGNEGDIWEEDIKDLVPIPLTEEILLKAGFEKDTGEFYIYKDITVRKTYYSDDFWRFIFKHQRIKDIKYLHDLQNTISALTGEEIKIEL
ncbi:hypothetical protein [Dysgonomonas capnocytophagoides]|uniref:hypothetical protein n=1 Tax=Dysgonomonas capnocytophagoides TaxID=45254 RepID=UPI000687ADB5|nr:hypothetical protein [Dysgonomonas capnocytophagoides]